MKQIYIVTAINNDSILVTPEQKLAEPGVFIPGIEVTNPSKFRISAGSKVTIGLSRKKEAVAGILALLIPICAGAAALFFSPFISSLLKKECTELFKAGIISLGFLTACAFVFAASRTIQTTVKLQIKKVIQ